MSDLPYQPLETKDFSGGETDYFIQGSSLHFKKGTNLWVEPDKSLRLRWGSRGYDDHGNHLVPGVGRRVDSLFLFDNKQDLFAHQGRDIYYLNSSPAWTRLLGPTGNEALGAGQEYTQLSHSEWKGHTYVASDAGAIPSKIYKDHLGVPHVLTVGLPKPKAVPAYTNLSLLSRCIGLANALRTSMVLHFKNNSNTSPAVGPVDGYLHGLIDKWSLSYFEAQSWSIFDIENPGPIPAPTPAPLATDETSLYVLVQALSKAYEHHGFDLSRHAYHFQMNSYVDPIRGPYEPLDDTSLPSTLERASAQLDQLRKVWNWHRLSVYGHDRLNVISSIDIYKVLTPAIGNPDLAGVPVVTPNYADLYRYVNYFKEAYNRHVTNNVTGSDWDTTSHSFAWTHTQQILDEKYTLCTLPDCATLEDCFLLIYWLCTLYGQVHLEDTLGYPTHTNVTFTTTAGSANITAVALIGGGATELPVGSFLTGGTGIYSNTFVNNNRSAKVTASAVGTATLSKTFQASVVGQSGQYGFSTYHASFSGGSTLLSSSSSLSNPGEDLTQDILISLAVETSALPKSTDAWIDLAVTCLESLNIHASNTKEHYLTGFPTSSFLQGNGPFFIPEVETVVYGFTYKHSYEDQSSQTFENISAPIFTDAVETCKIYPISTIRPYLSDGSTNLNSKVTSLSSVSLSNLPVLVNSSLDNYDTGNIFVQIYRTINDGTTFYLEGEVANGVTTFTDSVPDSLSTVVIPALDTRETLYTTGGRVENTQPPSCKFLHILDNTAYYGYILNEDGSVLKNRFIQSIPGTPDAAPANFFDDLDDELVGIESVRSNVLVFCTHSIYRIKGSFDAQGGGSLSHDKISEEVGCLNSSSIVVTEIGLFYAGSDGFYYTDGFQNIKISLNKDISYSSRTQSDQQKNRIKGSYDRTNRRIYWTMQEYPSESEAKEVWVYHLNFGVKPGGVFTTHSSDEDFRVSSHVFYLDNWIRGDGRGIVFKHDELYQSDLKVPSSLATSLSQWETKAIPWEYASCALDFGQLYKGQWVSRIHMLGENHGNSQVQMTSVADNRATAGQGGSPLAPIRYTDNPIWGDARVNWGDPDFVWRYDGKLDVWRRFPHSSLRSQLKQVVFTPASIGVYRYDDYPELSFCNVDSVAKTATLLQPSGFSQLVWPKDATSMAIAFDGDGYTQEFVVTSVSGAILTFSDAGSLSATAPNQKWVIRGLLKEAGFHLQSYVLQFASFGQRGQNYQGGTSRGENAP